MTVQHEETAVEQSIRGLLHSLDEKPQGPSWCKALAEGFFHRSDDNYLAQRDPKKVLKQWLDLAGWVTERSELRP